MHWKVFRPLLNLIFSYSTRPIYNKIMWKTPSWIRTHGLTIRPGLTFNIGALYCTKRNLISHCSYCIWTSTNVFQNISGTIVALINIISIWLAPNPRTAAIYYFITALFILLACFDTYFALPLNVSPIAIRTHSLLYLDSVVVAGAVGWVVSFDTKGPWIEYNHRHFLLSIDFQPFKSLGGKDPNNKRRSNKGSGIIKEGWMIWFYFWNRVQISYSLMSH